MSLLGNAPDPELTARLKHIVGDAGWSDDPLVLAPRLVDRMGVYKGTTALLLRPSGTQQVCDILHACNSAGVAVVPQGGNTGLVGGATPSLAPAQVLLGLDRMNRVRAVDEANATLTVEAGCVLADIQALAREKGRLFPLSIGSEGSAQIGGVLSTNAGGVQVLKYGMARDLVLGLEVVLPDGRVLDAMRGLRKDNTGYDLKQLFIGAEGTLGVITAAVLKMHPLPQEVETAFVAVRDPQAAVLMLGRLQARLGDGITACELLCAQTVALVRSNIPRVTVPLGDAPWYLLVECTGTAGSAARAGLEDVLEGAIADGLVLDAALAQSHAQAAGMWAVRHCLGESRRPEGGCLNYDVSVPVSRVCVFIERATAACRALDEQCRISAYGHIGDGNVHFSVMQAATPAAGQPADEAFIGRSGAISQEVYGCAITLGGSISAEHGIGQDKRDMLLRQKSAVEMELMHALKNLLDPKQIMNPGKLLCGGPSTEK